MGLNLFHDANCTSDDEATDIIVGEISCASVAAEYKLLRLKARTEWHYPLQLRSHPGW